MYMSAKLQGAPILLELTFPQNATSCVSVTKTPSSTLAQITQNVIVALLSAPSQ